MEGKIKNFDELATTPARRLALAIAEAGLQAIDTGQAISERVKFTGEVLSVDGEMFDLQNFKQIFIVGVGKCALAAGIALQDVLGDRLSGGIILTPNEPSFEIRNSKLEIRLGTHPFPTQANVEATSAIIRLLSSLTERDLVIFIISGGGSTLLCQPDKITYAEEREILKVLFQKGVTIREINTLRKHLSLARGGRLAEYAYPATSLALIFSDVPGDDLELVASGPTVKDSTTAEEARMIIRKYDLEKAVGFQIEPLETPKEDQYFEKVENIIFISNQTALLAMKKKALELSLYPEIRTSVLMGEAREAGLNIAEEINTAIPGTAYLYGGETTVTIKGNGRGGRNQELALSALPHIGADAVILALASDGRDNGNYGGALCDIIIKEKADTIGLKAEEYLVQNDSSGFFEKTGGLLMTGDTGSNVSDLIIALKQ